MPRAVIADLLGPRTLDDGVDTLPAQIDAIGPQTQLVTLTIGANDVNLGGLDFCTSADGDCEKQLGQATDEALQALPSQLDAVFAAIARRAPDATVIATGYFPVFESQHTCADTQLVTNPDDLVWLDSVQERLDHAIEDSANRHHAKFVMPADSAEHTTCAPTQEQWTSFDGLATGSYGQHPTPLGQDNMAEQISNAAKNPAS